MNFICEVKNCKNSSNLADLFIAPRNKRILRHWQKAIGTNASEFFVCERHFTKKDIIVEKNLEETAVPQLHLTDDVFKLENDCCGLCLNASYDLSEISKDASDMFKEISQFEPLTSLICRDCKLAMKTYKKFQTEIQQKHLSIRNAAINLEESDQDSDDCVIVEDDHSQSTASSSKTNEKPNISVPEIKQQRTNCWKADSHRTRSPDSLGFKSSVKCLDCQKVMGVEELLAHRLEEHPNSEEESKTYPSMPTPPYPPPSPKSKKNNKSRNEGTSDDIIVACEFCFMEMYEKNLEKHIGQCHTEKGKDFLCHVCSKAFTKEMALKYHLVSHYPEQMFVCDICDRKYTMKTKLNQHIRKSHLNLKKFAVQCNICLKKFREKKKFPQHMETYHKDGYDCGARANSETNFFDCYKCGASYYALLNYKRHDCEKGRFQIRCNDCQLPMTSTEKLKLHQANDCKVKKPNRFGPN